MRPPRQPLVHPGQNKKNTVVGTRSRKGFVFLAVWLATLSLLVSAVAQGFGSPPPNIVFILADDMGYGDPQCFNPQSKMPTPNIDRLATQGMRFTDAHASASLCVPSRYGLLTGRCPLRAPDMNSDRRALIESNRVTIASLLHDHGYATGMVGKWHLGFTGGEPYNYSQPMLGGPFNHGFDYFFGQHASLDIPPYFFVENDHCVTAPTAQTKTHYTEGWSKIQGAFWRGGGIAPDFDMEQVLPTYTQKAVNFIEQHGAGAKPFFLYVAFTAPHTPWLPTEAFRGKSAGNLYGDWVAELDDSVGKVLAELDHANLTAKTLVFFSSDNGPVWYPADVKKYGHAAAGNWRGMKADAWEGGHREPLIARWPGKIQPGTTNEQMVSFTDMLATFADVAYAAVPAGAGEDSISFLPAMLGQAPKATSRKVMVLGFKRDNCSVRLGQWKLIPFLGSGGFTAPAHLTPQAGQPAGQLYDLAADPGETNNVYAQRPDLVAQLTAELNKVIPGGDKLPVTK